MAIIDADKNRRLEKIEIEVSPSLLKDIDAYCKWANVKDVSMYFEQAAEYVLKKDTEWKRYKKTLRKEQ